MMILKVERVTQVQLPSKAHTTDAGLDFFLPSDLSYIVKEGKGVKIGTCERIIESTGETIVSTAIEIKPHKSVLLPMGLRVEFPKGYGLVFFNRSSVASKKHLFRGACVVDNGYSGILFVNLTNVSDETQYLCAGEKLIQAMLLPVPEVDIEEGKVDIDTDRGNGGFGSTDK